MSDFNFDIEPDISGNNFVRNNKVAMQTMFNSTEISPFWIADMEFEIDTNIREEIKRIADRGVFSYEKPQDDMNTILCDWFEKRHGLNLSPDRFQVITGVLTGIAVMLQEFSAPGESVLIQTPVYHQFKKLIEGNGRVAVNNPLKLVDGRYEMDLEDLEQKLKLDETKILMVCNPHNPMGRVWSKAELEKVVALAKKYGVFLMSDEIHSDIILKGHKFESMTQFGYEYSAALLGSPAKTFGMQASSCGFIYAGHEEVHQRIFKRIESMYLFHVSTITMHATRMAYLKAAPWVDALVAYTDKSIAALTQFIALEMPQIKVIKPEGTYQVWLDFRTLNLSNEALDQLILHKAKVGLTPGYWFGQEGSGFMRMNLGCSQQKVISALSEIKKALF